MFNDGRGKEQGWGWGLGTGIGMGNWGWDGDWEWGCRLPETDWAAASVPRPAGTVDRRAGPRPRGERTDRYTLQNESRSSASQAHERKGGQPQPGGGRQNVA